MAKNKNNNKPDLSIMYIFGISLFLLFAAVTVILMYFISLHSGNTTYELIFPNSTTICTQADKFTNTSFELINCTGNYAKGNFNIFINLNR